ncbi:helix-turn-helix domain-containing protein [Streptomyces sp. NPDC059740]|uniref:helix-turn-helix domain-containing protein n=1 Tax=Streptomyces sp. NPDC059740 TaxID=3346926 RepID=UPI003650B603
MAPRKSTGTRERAGKQSARQVLAAELARLREQSGRSLGDLAKDTTYDRTYLYKLETGERLGSPEVVAALEAVYGTGGHLADLWELARRDGFKDRFKRFMDLERRAVMRYEYASATVPGLLQTEDYAREQLRTARPRDEEELAEEVALRTGRQSVLFGPEPVQFRAVLDEAVLRRPMADAKQWAAQLRWLLDAAELSHITLQVLPFTAGLQHLLGGSLTLLWLPGGKSMAYTEGSWSGELVETPADVDKLRLYYDLLRDSSLPPRDSVALIHSVLEACT